MWVVGKKPLKFMDGIRQPNTPVPEAANWSYPVLKAHRDNGDIVWIEEGEKNVTTSFPSSIQVKKGRKKK